MKLYPQAQGSLFVGVYDDMPVFDHKAAFDRRRSEAEKLKGETLAESHLNEWKAAANAWVRNHYGQEMTSEDIEEAIGQPTDVDGRPNNAGVGGYIAGLARRRVIEKVGWTKSTRISNHGSDLRLWCIIGTP